MSDLSLNHFSIRSLQIEKTRDFFTQVIGLKEGPRPDFPFPGHWLYCGDTSNYAHAVLHLIAMNPTDPVGLKNYLGDRDATALHGSGAVDHVAFFATDLAAMIKKLKQSGVDYKQRTVPSIGLHQLFLVDPNGIVIELNYPANEHAAQEQAG